MKDKLEFLLQNKGLTATSLARLLDIQPSGISHILSGRNKPSFDLVVKILKLFPDVSPDWLLLGEGAPLRSSSELGDASERSSPTSAVFPNESLFATAVNNEISESNSVLKNENVNIFSGIGNASKCVERIIVLYTDKSFESYTPNR